MADRIVVMRAGRIEQTGRPLELYDRPENIFVAQFIGTPTMNILEATVSNGRLHLFDGALVLDRPGLPDGPLLAGLRPEHVAIVGPAGGIVNAVLELIEPMGNETMTSCTIGRTTLQTCGTERISMPRGAAVGVTFDPERLHFFDRETELRLEPATVAMNAEMA